MSYEEMLKLSGVVDVIIGISGATMAIMWDFMIGNGFHLGIRAVIAILAGVFFVIKGKTQLDLAS